MPQIQPQPQSAPMSQERMIEAIASTLTPEQQAEIVREALAMKFAASPLSTLLGLSPRPHSQVTPAPREPKDYLGGIVDVTVVSVDPVKANMARIIMKDARGQSYLWDATSAKGLALKPGDKRRITGTVLGREGGHVHVGRVRFYGKNEKGPVRFDR